MRSLGWSACSRWDFAYVYLQAWRNVSPLQNEKHPPRNGYKLLCCFAEKGGGVFFPPCTETYTHVGNPYPRYQCLTTTGTWQAWNSNCVYWENAWPAKPRPLGVFANNMLCKSAVSNSTHKQRVVSTFVPDFDIWWKLVRMYFWVKSYMWYQYVQWPRSTTATTSYSYKSNYAAFWWISYNSWHGMAQHLEHTSNISNKAYIPSPNHLRAHSKDVIHGATVTYISRELTNQKDYLALWSTKTSDNIWKHTTYQWSTNSNKWDLWRRVLSLDENYDVANS